MRDLHLAHPDLTIMLTLAENPMAHAATNDLVVHIGAVKDSSWVGHLLAPNERLLCASSAFVRHMRNKLTHPSELERLPCLCLKENDDVMTRWRFTGRSGKVVAVAVNGALACNDGPVITRWATDGLGVIVRSSGRPPP